MFTRNKRTRPRRAGAAGMTLAEIMIVLAILSMVMAAVAFGGISALDRARKKDTRIVMQQIENAIVQWQTDSTDSCPGSLDELVQKKLLKKEPKDGWNHPFIFKCPGDHNNDLDLISKGKDGKEGTEDDIKSWEEDDAGDKGKKP